MTLVWSAPSTAGKADATNSTSWRATRDLPGYTRNTYTTLEDAKAGSDTVIDCYGISSNPGENNLPGRVNVDSISFNGCTTDFKATGGGGGGGGSLENVLPS